MPRKSKAQIAPGARDLQQRQTIAALDKKIAVGIDVTRVRSGSAHSSDTYCQQAMSADDAWFISRGRGDLC